MPQLENLVLDPEWQPFACGASGDQLSFVHLPRHVQRQLTFLDRRLVSGRPMAGPFPVHALPRALVRSQAGPANFIFHTAFCCSTLLARAFDQPGASMGLKEPEIITSFSDAFERKGETFEFHDALGIGLDLLSRPLAPNETQIIKPSNFANHLAPSLLDIRPTAKAIIMQAPLETYLRTTSKRELSGRSFNREALMQMRPFMPLHPGMTDAAIMRLSDLQVAAIVWLMQAQFFQHVIARYGSSRVRTLSSETFLAKRADTLTLAAAFFDVRLPASASWKQISAGPLFAEHAKMLGVSYSSELRHRELETAGRAHAQEIGAALKWAEGVARKLGGVGPLGDTLFEPSQPEQAPAQRPGSDAPQARQAPRHSL